MLAKKGVISTCFYCPEDGFALSPVVLEPLEALAGKEAGCRAACWVGVKKTDMGGLRLSLMSPADLATPRLTKDQRLELLTSLKVNTSLHG